tara:strand:- start:26 stop:298 length:273 start_codon:yes stop_codon:yes gene_type:complete
MNMGNKGMNWDEEVKDYKKQYDDEDGIYEYVESLVPVYYGDISNTFNDMSELITADEVGVPIWQVMTKHIFNAYLESFMEVWTPFEDEEE